MGKEPLTFEQATWLVTKLIRSFFGIAFVCTGLLLLGMGIHGFVTSQGSGGCYALMIVGPSLSFCGLLFIPKKPEVARFYQVLELKKLAKSSRQ